MLLAPWLAFVHKLSFAKPCSTEFVLYGIGSTSGCPELRLAGETHEKASLSGVCVFYNVNRA